MRGGWSVRKVEATATFMTLMKNLQEKEAMEKQAAL